MEVGTLVINKKPRARKSLCQFSDLFYVKQKNTVCQLGAAKEKFKTIRKGNLLQSTIKKQKEYTKINALEKQYL